MRLYRNRAAEFEELADKALVPTAQRRYRSMRPVKATLSIIRDCESCDYS